MLARSNQLTQQMMATLPADASSYTLPEIVRGAETILDIAPAAADDASAAAPSERTGSKQLQALRARLERNRLTMPLFDTRGWVRDFEKALKIQWEVYANGLLPMHIVVARSDRIYGIEPVVEALE